MLSYTAIVHKEAGTAYGISFPDLDGCFSAADASDDLLANAIQALSLYAEGEADLPKPRSLLDIMNDPDVRREVRAGAVLLAVPLIVETKKERLNVILPSDIVAATNVLAEAAGMNRSEFIASLLRREIGGTHAIARRPARRGRPKSEKST